MSQYSVVVVARDQQRQLLGTLLALRKHANPSEVLLVDNASSSNLSSTAALAQLPIRHLRLPELRSLSAALNVGLDAAAHDLVLLLHGDVLLESDPAAAVAFLDREPEVGVLGGKLMRSGADPRRVLHAGYEIDSRRLGPRPLGLLDWDRYQDIVDVPAVSTACMLVRRTEVRFDERFWYRLEDVDLCHQYRQRGYRVVFFPCLTATDLEDGGAKARRQELSWAARRLATQWLYHARWCSEKSLVEHPRQVAVRGAAALEALRRADAAYGCGGDDAGGSDSGTHAATMAT